MLQVTRTMSLIYNWAVSNVTCHMQYHLHAPTLACLSGVLNERHLQPIPHSLTFTLLLAQEVTSKCVPSYVCSSTKEEQTQTQALQLNGWQVKQRQTPDAHRMVECAGTTQLTMQASMHASMHASTCLLKLAGCAGPPPTPAGWRPCGRL